MSVKYTCMQDKFPENFYHSAKSFTFYFFLPGTRCAKKNNSKTCTYRIGFVFLPRLQIVSNGKHTPIQNLVQST